MILMRVSKCTTKQDPATISKRYPKVKPGTKGVYFKTSWLYDSDIAFLKERGIPINVALRDGLYEYVLKIKDKEHNLPALHTMTKIERERWIMTAPDDFRPAPGPRTAPAVVLPEIPQGPVPDMSTWTKVERDQWILSGDIPVRAMTASAPARAQVSMDCTEN